MRSPQIRKTRLASLFVRLESTTVSGQMADHDKGESKFHREGLEILDRLINCSALVNSESDAVQPAERNDPGTPLSTAH